jgi:hypothetical protein
LAAAVVGVVDRSVTCGETILQSVLETALVVPLWKLLLLFDYLTLFLVLSAPLLAPGSRGVARRCRWLATAAAAD